MYCEYYVIRLVVRIVCNIQQAEAEVVPSSGSVQFKLESDLACLTLSYLEGGAKRPRFWRLVVPPRRLYLSY